MSKMARIKSELLNAKNTAEELALKVAKARVQARALKKESDTLKTYAGTGISQVGQILRISQVGQIEVKHNDKCFFQWKSHQRKSFKKNSM